MSNLDEMKANLENTLALQRAQHTQRTDDELRELTASLLREFKANLPGDPRPQAEKLAAQWRAPAPPVNRLADLSGSNQLQQLDEAFVELFNLGAYYPARNLRYPTVYCETLAEFYAPWVEQENLSASARQALLQQYVQAAETQVRERGGGVFGVNLPGKGAYLNGWLFVHGLNLAPRQAFQRPDLLRRILGTAVHEKLGHGFLSVYSALGQVKTRLGLDQFETARRFGLQTADDPLSSLRRQQANLIFTVSQLLEEGWATWLETSFDARLTPGAPPHRHALPPLYDALHSLPAELEQRSEIQEALLKALVILFGDQEFPGPVLLQAVSLLEVLGSGLDDFFMQRLGQPLRYVVGELLMIQAEANLGAHCAPYAALIAANVTFNPGTVGLADLGMLLNSDPRLHPDTRLAALSRLTLEQKNSLPALVQQASAELSLSIPAELKK